MRFVLLLVLPFLLHAHKMYVSVEEQGGGLQVSAYFSKSSTCRGCEIRVFDGDMLLVESKTDDNGKAFVRVEKDGVRVEVNDFSGHKEVVEFSKKPTTSHVNSSVKTLVALFLIIVIFYSLYVYKRRFKA